MANALRTITLSGTPRERGRAHGEAFRSDILELLTRWKDGIAQSLRVDPDAHLAGFVRGTQITAAVERYTPELQEEIRGIGEGARVPFDTIFAWQCYAALEWFGRPRIVELAKLAEHCTALGVAAEGAQPTFIAQNLDLPRLREGYALIQHHVLPDTDLELLVVGSVGSIGDSGLNNQGVGVVENTVSQLDHRMDGLPDFMVARGILIRRSFEAAASFVRSVEHACGHNYIIGAPDRVIDFECSAKKVVRYEPTESGRRVWHSNHPVVNDEQGQWRDYLAALPEAFRQQMQARSTTTARLEGAARRLRDERRPVTLETVQGLLCSHDEPICVHNDRSVTTSAIIQVLSDSPELYITNGPPCTNAYEHFAF